MNPPTNIGKHCPEDLYPVTVKTALSITESDIDCDETFVHVKDNLEKLSGELKKKHVTLSKSTIEAICCVVEKIIPSDHLLFIPADETTPQCVQYERTCTTLYLVSQDDKAINPDQERFYAKRMNATTREVKSSHVSMVRTRPTSPN